MIRSGALGPQEVTGVGPWLQTGRFFSVRSAGDAETSSMGRFNEWP